MFDILPQLLVNALITGSIYALAATGLSLTYGLLRVLNFAHGHMLMVGAYLFYWLAIDLNLGLVLSAIGVSLLTVILASIALEIFINPFTKYSSFLPFVTTLALSIMLESIVSMVFGVNVKSLSVGIDISSMEFNNTWLWPFTIYVTPIQIIIVSSALVLLGALAAVIHGTSLGRRLRSLSENGPAAQALGVNSKLVTYGVFTTGMLLATYAGIMIGYETNLQPTMGNAYTIKAFAAMILGGLGNIWGTVIGSFILGLVENLSIGLQFGDFSIPAGYKDAFAFMIILLVLMFKPEGLFSRKKRTA